MSNQVTLAYEGQAVAITLARLQALLQAVPQPIEFLSIFGCRITSDNTTVVNPVTRTLVISFLGSGAVPDATLTIRQDGVITAVTPGVRGQDLIRSPGVAATPGTNQPGAGAQLRSFLRVNAVAVVSGGSGYIAPVAATFLGGLPPANALSPTALGCVRRIYLTDRGLGYPAGTTVEIAGGSVNGNTPTAPARATLTRDAAGRITSVTLIDMGVGYVKRPVVVFRGPGGAQPRRLAKGFVAMAQGTPARAGVVTVGGGPFPVTAVAVASPGTGYIEVPTILLIPAAGPTVAAVTRARMEVDRIDIINGGKGYQVGFAAAALTPYFKTFFPNGGGQDEIFFRLMECSLSRGAFTPMRSVAPVLA